MVKHVMERKLHKITILPAIFLEKRNDKYLVRCLVGEVTQDVLFDSFSLEGMINPKYLLIGIMTGVGFSQITFAQGDEFEDLFKKKWKILIK
jgi:hypothetical protein